MQKNDNRELYMVHNEFGVVLAPFNIFAQSYYRYGIHRVQKGKMIILYF